MIIDLSRVPSRMYLDAGTHNVHIFEIEFTEARTGTKMMAITFKSDSGAKITDRYALTENAMWKIKILTDAAGLMEKKVDTSRLLGKKVCIKVAKQEAADGKFYSEVVSVWPCSANMGQKDETYDPLDEIADPIDETPADPF